jgi:hypothetical protein
VVDLNAADAMDEYVRRRKRRGGRQGGRENERDGGREAAAGELCGMH